MIKTFKHKGLEKIFYTGNKKGIKADQASRLERIIDCLNAASDIKDMNYPGSHLHELKGDKKGCIQFEYLGIGGYSLSLEMAMCT